MSLYEVSGIRPHEGFFLRDLIRGGEPVWVHERSTTLPVVQWDRIGARVMRVNDRAQLSGVQLLFDWASADELIAEFDKVSKATAEDLAGSLVALAAEAGEEVDEETAGIIDALKGHNVQLTVDETLAASAFMFSTCWLRGLLGDTLDPRMPELFNSDGDPLEPTEVLYPLAARATPGKVQAALARIPAFRQENDDFWNWVEVKDSGKRELPKSGRVIFSEMEDGSTVLGTLDLDDDSLLLSVNSSARAARGRELIEPMLGKLVLEPKIEQRTIEEMMDEMEEDEEEGEEDDLPVLIPQEEQIEATWKFLDDHYKRILDQPIGILGDVSPREAARNPEQRGKAVDWVKSVENNLARQALASPARHYDCGWIWNDLGLDSYRNAEPARAAQLSGGS